MAGRRTKYTEEVIGRIEEAIRLGASYRLASLYAGIAESTFHEWRNTKPEFSERVTRAEGVGAVGWLKKIEKAATDEDWRAAAWKLERRYPNEYGRQVLEHQGKDGSDLTLKVIYEHTDGSTS